MKHRIKHLLITATVLSASLFTQPTMIAQASVNDITNQNITIMANAGTSYQTTSGVNFRTGPSTKYKVIRYLKRGTTATHISNAGNWIKVKVGNDTGYISKSYLSVTKTANTPTPTGTIYKTRANVNFRTGPSTKYNKIAYLYKGTSVEYLGASGSWSKVRVNGRDGYVSTSYLDISTQSSKAPTESGVPYTIKSRVNFRTGPSTRYSTMRKLYAGNEVELLSRHNNTWSKIKVGGTVGYVSHRYLTPKTTSTPAPAPTPTPKPTPVPAPTPPAKTPANSLGFKGGITKTVLDMKKWEGTSMYSDPKYKHFVNTSGSHIQGLIDAGHIARWGAPIDNHDGMITWIVSHAHGGFSYMRSNIKVGSLVDVTDKNGKTRTYKITDDRRNASNSWDLKFSNGDTLWDIYATGGAGEGILLQMCQIRNGVSANHFYLGKPIN